MFLILVWLLSVSVIFGLYVLLMIGLIYYTKAMMAPTTRYMNSLTGVMDAAADYIDERRIDSRKQRQGPGRFVENDYREPPPIRRSRLPK